MNKEQQELPEASIEQLDLKQKEVLDFFARLLEDKLPNSSEAGATALKMIAGIMTEQRLLEDEPQRKEWLYNFIGKVGKRLINAPNYVKQWGLKACKN